MGPGTCYSYTYKVRFRSALAHFNTIHTIKKNLVISLGSLHAKIECSLYRLMIVLLIFVFSLVVTVRTEICITNSRKIKTN